MKQEEDGWQVSVESPEQTEAVGYSLGLIVQAGDSIGLVGDLGAGKTLFVQGLARGLDVPREIRVTSPTFTLVNEYKGGRLNLYHADLYRLEEEGELLETGLEELFWQGGVVAVEWCDRFPVMPEEHLLIRLLQSGEGRRLVAVGYGVRGKKLAIDWSSRLPPFGY